MTTITLPRAVVEQALKALEALLSDDLSPYAAAKIIVALRAAQEQAEPVPPFPPVPQRQRGCAVCGVGADGKAYGYVCQRHDCPTRVTCGGAV